MTVILASRAATDRRARILDAARFLILRRGLRATTMEAIAAEARIAKPTLYRHFSDKDAVFGAIVDELIAEVRQGFEAALHGDGDVVERVGAALGAKYEIIARLLDGSPHAGELYGEQERTSAPAFRVVEDGVEAAIAAELAAAGIAQSPSLTRLLLAGAYGIGRKAHAAAEIGPAIRLLTERLLRPELE